MFIRLPRDTTVCLSWSSGTFWIRRHSVVYIVKAPWNAALFSERNGYCDPVKRWRGWRYFKRLVPRGGQ